MATKTKPSKTAAPKLSDKLKKLREKPEAQPAPKTPRAAAKTTPKPKPGVEKTRDGLRVDSKAAQVIELLEKKGGATLEEVAAFADWQKHTVRGFIAGTLGNKLGLKVESTKNKDGARTYAIVR